MKILVSFILFIQAVAAYADSNDPMLEETISGWTSSGGELANDSRNPWWIDNTPVVRYCIQIDQATATASAHYVDAALHSAVAYWRGEFTSGYGVKVATQRFVRGACDSATDLKIQVGEGTLSRSQRTYLGENTNVQTLENEYYLNLNFQIVHMLLTIDRYVTDMPAIAKVLKISEQELARIINRLCQQGVVALRGGRYTVVRDMLHLSQNDPIFSAHNRLLRLRCIERLSVAQTPQPYSFSATMSADVAAFESIRSDFLKLIKKTQKTVSAAPQNHVFQMNFDLFSWDG